MKNKSLLTKIGIHIGIIATIILLIECLLCNYKHYLSVSTPSTYEVSETYLNGFTYEEEGQCYVATKNNPSLEITNINTIIHTIYVDAKPVKDSSYHLVIKVDYTDETRLTYQSGASKNIDIIQGYENSKYLQEDFNGMSEKIRLTFSISSGEKIYLNQIAFNKKIPFHFSIARVIAMSLISYTIYLFVMLFHYRDTIKEKKKMSKFFKIAIASLCGVLIILVYGVLFPGFHNYILQSSGTQISQELVDMIMHGKISLLAEPSEELINLLDPYVPANRNGISYLWDHVYFEGKYYSYYGLTPVFLLFLPVKLLTGKYLYDGVAVLLFSLVSLIFLTLAYYKFIKKNFNTTPLFMQLAGFIILFMSCGILTNIVRPAFYEVSTSCANMCMMIGLYHLISSNVLSKDTSISKPHIAFSSIWISLAVLSRATFALYAVCAVIIILIYYFANRKQMNVKHQVSYFLAALIPYAIFGGAQCLYNYARFHSFLEFGIQYSLTINDFTNTTFHTSFAITSLWNFMFAVPTLNDINYFVHPNALTFGASGYYFFETDYAIGLYSRVPILYLCFALPFMKFNKSGKEKALWSLKYILPCVILPFIQAIITWQSGFAVRYYSDFAWASVLFIIYFMFYLYDQAVLKKDISKVKLIAVIFTICVFTAFIGTMATVYCYVPNFGRHIGVVDYRYTYHYYQIARELSFWY